MSTRRHRRLNIRTIALILHTLPWAVFGLTCALVWPGGRLLMRVARKGWGPQVLRLAGIRARVEGLERVDPSQTYVVAANHQSQLDIPLIFSLLPFPVRFMAKRSLFLIPVFGWAIWLAGFIPIDRGNRIKAKRSIENGARRLCKGPSVIVFPEGTRTPDEAVHAFKSGAFVLALKAGVPVLPVAIDGTYDILPKWGLGVMPGDVKVIIGDPIPCAGLTMKDKSHVRGKAQAAVEEMLASGRPV